MSEFLEIVKYYKDSDEKYLGEIFLLGSCVLKNYGIYIIILSHLKKEYKHGI